MTSEAESYKRSQWWDWKSDTEIRAKLVLVEGKNRELCVVASERMADLADTASGLAEKCMAANKQLSNMAKLLQAELERATRQVIDIRKQRTAGAAVDAELAYAEGLADGIRSAMCFGGLEGVGENKTCDGCFLVNPESCPRDESQPTTKCILSA